MTVTYQQNDPMFKHAGHMFEPKKPQFYLSIPTRIALHEALTFTEGIQKRAVEFRETGEYYTQEFRDAFITEAKKQAAAILAMPDKKAYIIDFITAFTRIGYRDEALKLVSLYDAFIEEFEATHDHAYSILNRILSKVEDDKALLVILNHLMVASVSKPAC